MSATAHKSSLLTTTVRLPKRLYEEARGALEKGKAGASSLNDLLIKSLEETGVFSYCEGIRLQ